MPYEVIIITGRVVNCYLIKTGKGFIMVDTGFSFSSNAIDKVMAGAGCKPGDLKLIILTHGDYDHTGNCIFLREKYGARIAIHRSEATAVETADMISCRRTRQKAIFRTELAMGRFVMGRPFKPDILFIDGDDLSQYGFDAKIVHTPGHTIGSISILTAQGDLFCGDFLVGGGKPRKNSLVDDTAEMDGSVLKLKSLNIKTVYPGHGKPFPIKEFWENHR